jgi:phage shock protein E
MHAATNATMRFLLVLLMAAASCSQSDGPPPNPSTSPTKDPVAARALIASGATVIDVRTSDEFARGHLPRAVNLPVQELPARIAEVEKLVAGERGRPIVVYCAVGGRAAKAKSQLEMAGYTHVVNGGGFDDLR